ncbi:hypothetical protein [Prolixibacter sp. SD074]|jgi:hypothetical protein|uniref:hypothetical protein n=1 Tax=Prolixibacter sp. SD074 TaxID=2652391 RepID=UPI00126B2C18|nr:hypothetical protein [Prolixibacter sp. SD074]GET30738.1 hypothetical protein SD074_29400 [Prolixibacter sp. SD074]
MGMKFFHVPRSKDFYMPYRFYDPRKEEMADREARIKAELGIKEEGGQDKVTPGTYKTSIKGSFRQGLSRGLYARQQRRKSNIRVIVILVLLALLAFYMLK